MSADPPNADIDRCFLYVGLGPQGDIGLAYFDHFIGCGEK